MSTFHPDLAVARFIPNFSMSPRMLRLMRRPVPKSAEQPRDVSVRNIEIPGWGDTPPVSVRLYEPIERPAPAPALLWIHGGGFLIGDPEQDERSSIGFVRELGITVAAVRYRRAPEHPSPAAVDDAYSALAWLFDRASYIRVDPSRIAIGGASAGGGIAAALALMAHDRGALRPAYQLLVYPMLDDRTATRADIDTRGIRMWTPASNHYAWTSYLGHAPGEPGVSPYAAPARRDDLSQLPPAWIGVGTNDLFHDEDVEYAQRLREAGVPCELVEVDRAFHGFDAILPKAGVSRGFWQAQADALRAALLA